jgi:putative membrane protein
MFQLEGTMTGKGDRDGLDFKPSHETGWIRNLKSAVKHSPGPASIGEAVKLALKGVCMGTADIIPGVSGGTMALITGIYQPLLEAIRSVDLEAVRLLVRGDFAGSLSRVHLRFLIPLLTGIGAALISLARVVNHLLHHHPVLIWSLFCGLIAASILVVGRRVPDWRLRSGVAAVAGAAMAFGIIQAVPVTTPHTPVYIFLSGMVAICAMILPGISGAFILLILGKYEFITATLKNPFTSDSLMVILLFCGGCIVGLAGFARLLNTVLNRWYATSLAFLTGLMAGAMPRIWPWKEVVAAKIIRGKEHILKTQNILPERSRRGGGGRPGPFRSRVFGSDHFRAPVPQQRCRPPRHQWSAVTTPDSRPVTVHPL